MFVTGPDVIKTVTHEEVTKQELGGAMTHNAKSGVAHFAARDDRECLAMIRELIGFLPSNNLEDPPRIAKRRSTGRADETLNRLVPEDAMQPYDIKDVIHRIVDEGYFFEVQEHFAQKSGGGIRETRWAARGNRSQSAGISGGRAGYQRFGKGRALRAVLRRFQYPSGDV